MNNIDDNETQGIQFLKVNRYEVEQNVIFIDYSPDQMAKTILNYQNLKLHHRLSLAKNITAIEDVSQDRQSFNKLLLSFANDVEDIQHELIAYLKKIMRTKFKNNLDKNAVLEPLMALLAGTHLQIKEAACDLLSEAAHVLKLEEKRQIIKVAIDLGKSQDQENKIVSIQLIAKMTPDLPAEEAQNFFKNDYLSLYKDSSVRIKKQIVASTCLIAQNVRKQFLNKEIIQNFFIEKCRETVWGVRKACVQIMPQMIKMTETKKELLANTLINFTKDGNKIVKISAFKIIPEFIANYQSDKVPDKLLDIYLNLMDHEINQSVSRQHEIIVKMAHFFPGVMHTLGAEKWDVMKKLFNRLLLFKNIDVKLPIAASLHQISKIIGAQLSKEYMFSALDTILKDNSDNLKLSAISHISEFVELFEKNTRQNLIDVFLVLQKDPKKWRVRYQIAHQLIKLSKIYETETVFKYIFPISLKLCNDNVSEVRHEAAYQMYYVLQNLKDQELLQEMALESVKGYGFSQKYIQRQTFSKMIRNLYKMNNFEEKFMDLVIDLAKDKVTIVKIALAISIRQIIAEAPENQQKFDKAINILKADVEEISQYFEQTQ